MAEPALAEINAEGQAILAGIQEHGLPFTTADGEEWVEINIPDFRVVEGARGYRFVSSRGRVLNQNTKIVEARGPSDSHKAIAVNIHVPGAFGACVTTPIHTIVATAFHGPRPAPGYTADHIDRRAWRNERENLRWSPPADQMTNRDHTKAIMTIDGHEGEFKTFADVARVLGISVGPMRQVLRRLEPGESATFKGVTVRLREKRVKRVNPCDEAKSIGCSKKPRGETAEYMVYRKFMGGSSVEEIAVARGIKETSVRSYIKTVACKSPRDELLSLASRIALSTPALRRMAMEMAQHVFDVKPFDGAPARAFVEEHCPEMAQDWEVVLNLAIVIFRVTEGDGAEGAPAPAQPVADAH